MGRWFILSALNNCINYVCKRPKSFQERVYEGCYLV